MEGRQRELFLDRAAILQLGGTFQQIAEVLGAGLQLLLLVAHHRGHDVVPGGLALPDLLYEVDGGGGHQARGVVQEFGLEEGELQHVLREVLVLGLEADHLAERLEELVGGVDDQLEVELSDDVRFFLEDLRDGVLPSAAGDQLLGLWNLIGLLELGSDVQRSHSYQLQLVERHILDREVLVDQRGDGEDSLGEHLVLVVELAEPVQQLGPRLLGDGLMGGDVVGEPMAELLPAAEELHVLKEVFGHHLRVSDLQLQFRLMRERLVELPLAQALKKRPISHGEGVVALATIGLGLEVGDFLAEDAGVHVSVKQINYSIGLRFINLL